MTFLEISGIFSSHMGNITMLCILKARQQTTFIGLACVRKREENIYNIQLTHSWGMCLHCVRWLKAEQRKQLEVTQQGLGLLCALWSAMFGTAALLGRGLLLTHNKTHTQRAQLKASWAVTHVGMLGVGGGFLTLWCGQKPEGEGGDRVNKA